MKLIVEKIYCFYCLAFPLRGKVGISGNVEQRRASIEQEVRYKHGANIRVRCLLKMPIITSAYTFEQSLHRAFDRLYFPCKTMIGTNGGTEWWWSVNWVCAALAYCYGLSQGWTGQCCAAFSGFVLIFFVPLDLALCVVLIAAIEYAIVGVAAWWIFNILT